MMKRLLYFFILLLTSTISFQAIAQKTSYADEIFAENRLGDQEQKLNEHIAFYPNPIVDNFSISNDSGIRILKIEIHSIVGNRVRVFLISNQDNLKNIYIDDLKKGIYFVSLYFENEQSITQKILKK